ncbi:tRNA-dihydrouridine(47) synthase [NAD(P)(+)]-like [Dichanthelium oligosanthes]|uniref:tRNA-dihydrouridine(47) synthase [NAD(P)(+)] n=1 Tax=Dichanthelium oligosanthes TaxID=888268 RepID=A0A1E5VNX2_9POAL|nr:tRNA-dihydrouridine(47) synthase [NAD(P)(+)]-like [Dichanthelium oligosanthes]
MAATAPATDPPNSSPAVTIDASPPPRPTPEELVARAVAPVKPAFLRPPPVREVPKEEGKAGGGGAVVTGEKKSKRQLKRERQQEKKSTSHLCIEVGKSGNVDSCKYGTSCRFSHDIDAYLAQKPADLEGTCPFTTLGQLCPYGLTCRFLGTHKDNLAPQNQSEGNHERNPLSKDIQKLLWKNKYKFPKASAQIKLLGLKDGNKNKAEATNDDNPDGICELNGDDKTESLSSIPVNVEPDPPCKEIDNSEGEPLVVNSVGVEPRPLKKSKVEVDETQNGTGVHDNEAEFEDLNLSNGLKVSSNNQSSCRVDLITTPHLREKKIIDFREKLYLAPLTTVGNLPFRRLCKTLGADITCGEMAMCTNLLQGQASEWALLRRHPSEDLFGVQICGPYPDTVARTVELVDNECSIDFIDINMGCPIDIVVNKGAGSSLLTKPMRIKSIVQAASTVTEKPLTVKVRTAFFEGRNRADSIVSDIYDWGSSAITIHGRSRQQRYSKLADWDYIYQCAQKAPDYLHVIGNGDVFSFTDWNKHVSDCSKISTCMIARGALIKPWLFTEIKEQRHWDITSGERLNILKDFVHFGLEHWGCDSKGVETTRHFLLEWLSYTCRYIPVGLLDVIPQRLNWRPPSYYGRDDLETLMASDSAADWIRISEMLLGKVPEGFTFAPKHKSNAYDRAENG